MINSQNILKIRWSSWFSRDVGLGTKLTYLCALVSKKFVSQNATKLINTLKMFLLHQYHLGQNECINILPKMISKFLWLKIIILFKFVHKKLLSQPFNSFNNF